jgi:hypothetical protein
MAPVGECVYIYHFTSKSVSCTCIVLRMMYLSFVHSVPLHTKRVINDQRGIHNHLELFVHKYVI